MCGLFGVAFASRFDDGDIERARRALDVLTHRGPDQAGEAIADGVFLGHRRLSIVDLSEAGRQPMISSDGAVAIAVNGEIYNHLALRQQLGDAEFVSHSDSEVVLHGYRAWGLDGLAARLEGMYTIVIHDRDRGEVHAIRDRVGIKPLYVGTVDEGIVWSSELKAIVEFCGHRPPIDGTAAYDVLTYGYVPAPKSIYRGIQKLEPGSVTTFRRGDRRIEQRRYWTLAVDQRRLADAAEQLYGLLDDSVAGHLMADVPVGFFLSGGIDSSVVVHHAARHHDDPVAYTIGYDDADHDETEWAERAARHVGARHVVEVLAASDADDLLDRSEAWYDEPFADTSALPTFHVSRLARKHSVVALTGDGGDELFAGYRWYTRARSVRSKQALLGPVGRVVRPTSLAARGPAAGRYARVRSGVDQLSRFDHLQLYSYLMGDRLPAAVKRQWRRGLGIDDAYDDLWHYRRFDDPSLPSPQREQVIDFHTYLPDDILTKVDRASMAVSLEARVPLLATPVVEFAFSLDSSYHLRDGVLKAGLKAAYADALPHDLLHRPKRGFSIPLTTWKHTVLRRGHRTVREDLVARFVGDPDRN